MVILNKLVVVVVVQNRPIWVVALLFSDQVPNFVCSLFSQPIPWGLPRAARSPLIRRKVAPG